MALVAASVHAYRYLAAAHLLCPALTQARANPTSLPAAAGSHRCLLWGLVEVDGQGTACWLLVGPEAQQTWQPWGVSASACSPPRLAFLSCGPVAAGTQSMAVRQPGWTWREGRERESDARVKWNKRDLGHVSFNSCTSLLILGSKCQQQVPCGQRMAAPACLLSWMPREISLLLVISLHSELSTHCPMSSWHLGFVLDFSSWWDI